MDIEDGDEVLLGWAEVVEWTGFGRSTIERWLAHPQDFEGPAFPRPVVSVTGRVFGWHEQDVADFIEDWAAFEAQGGVEEEDLEEAGDEGPGDEDSDEGEGHEDEDLDDDKDGPEENPLAA